MIPTTIRAVARALPLSAGLCLLAVGGALMSGAPARAEPANDPSGIWNTESAGSRVRIGRCGGGYCGTLASVAGPGLDANNPDPALRGRKLVGVQILQAGSATADGYEGTIYNPNDGKTYTGKLTPKGPDRIEVAGCVLSVLCKRQIWTRAK